MLCRDLSRMRSILRQYAIWNTNVINHGTTWKLTLLNTKTGWLRYHPVFVFIFVAIALAATLVDIASAAAHTARMARPAPLLAAAEHHALVVLGVPDIPAHTKNTDIHS